VSALYYPGLQTLWERTDPRATPEHLGFIPSFFDATDPRPAAEQLDANYNHGGGWRPLTGFRVREFDNALLYGEDKPLRRLWRCEFRTEVIEVYQLAWVRITKADGSWEVSRVD
jgi:hypothetical protein